MLEPGVNRKNHQDVPECLAVVNDGDHVLDIALRKLTIFQVLLLVSDGFVSVPETQGDAGLVSARDSSGEMNTK